MFCSLKDAVMNWSAPAPPASMSGVSRVISWCFVGRRTHRRARTQELIALSTYKSALPSLASPPWGVSRVYMFPWCLQPEQRTVVLDIEVMAAVCVHIDTCCLMAFCKGCCSQQTCRCSNTGCTNLGKVESSDWHVRQETDGSYSYYSLSA